MPISTSSFGDDRDGIYSQYERAANYEHESIDYPALTPAQAETFLKRLGGGVEEKNKRVEGIGWSAEIVPVETGVQIIFDAHDELLDDLIRRFEEWVERG